MKREAGILLCCVSTLLAIGLVVVFGILSAQSSGWEGALKNLTRQALYLGIGLAVMYAVYRIEYQRLYAWRWEIAGFAALLLTLVLIPGIGTRMNGASRWIQTGPVRWQPSEIAKLAMLIVLSAVIARKGEQVRDLKRGVLPCMAIVGATALLILKEPDFGTAALVGGVGTMLVFAAGAPVWPLAVASVGGAAGLGVLIWQSPHRLGRVMAFLDPWDPANKAGYQIVHSLTALGSGGLLGRGAGGGVQKLNYLPESSTDFVLAIQGEEFGLLGTWAVVAAFACVLIVGLRISRLAPDAFGRLLAFGIVTMFTCQAILHTAVVTASMPTKGIALPFISHGGSSLVVSLAAVGVLLNIASQCPAEARALQPAEMATEINPMKRSV